MTAPLPNERRWELQTMASELIQAAPVTPHLELLITSESDLVSGRKIGAARERVIRGLFAWHVGAWRP
jgi:hypothetical protein